MQQQEIKEVEVEVHEPEVLTCGNVTRVCHPTAFFEMIEECKLCGRCV